MAENWWKWSGKHWWRSFFHLWWLLHVESVLNSLPPHRWWKLHKISAKIFPNNSGNILWKFFVEIFVQDASWVLSRMWTRFAYLCWVSVYRTQCEGITIDEKKKKPFHQSMVCVNDFFSHLCRVLHIESFTHTATHITNTATHNATHTTLVKESFTHTATHTTHTATHTTLVKESFALVLSFWHLFQSWNFFKNPYSCWVLNMCVKDSNM